MKDAPRLWQKVLRAVLLKVGMAPLKADPQLYVMHDDKKMVLVMSSHVDA